MATSPITIDPSDVQAHVDPSDVQVSPPAMPDKTPTPGVGQYMGSLGNEIGGMASEAGGMLKGLATTVFPGQNELVQGVQQIPAVYHAYESARQQGKGVIESAQAADAVARQQNQARELIKQRAKEFSDNPSQATGKTLMDLIPLAMGFAKGTPAAPEASAAEASATSEPGLVQQVLKGEKVAQPAAQGALRAGAQAGAAATGEAPVVEAAASNPSLRTSLTEPIGKLDSQAKSLYQQVDSAAGTDLKGLNEKLSNTEYQIRQLTDTEEDIAKEAKLEKSRQGLLDKIEAAKQTALDKGIAPKTLDLADQRFQQARALTDLETKVFKNPDVLKGNSAMGTPETVNIDAAVKALQRLQDNDKFGSSRLEQALGKLGANQLLKDMYSAQRLGVRALSKQQFVRRLGYALGATGLGGLALEKTLK